MTLVYQVVQLLKHTNAARVNLRAARKETERLGLLEVAQAIDVVIYKLDLAVTIVGGFTVVTPEG